MNIEQLNIEHLIERQVNSVHTSDGKGWQKSCVDSDGTPIIFESTSTPRSAQHYPESFGVVQSRSE